MSNGAPIANLNTAQVISGKFPLYSELRDFRLQPDIRGEAVIRGEMPVLTSVIMDIQRKIMPGAGNGYTLKKTRSYYWEEINNNSMPWAFTTSDTSNKTVNAAGTVITVSNPYSSTGAYSLPMANHRAIANVNGTLYTVLVTAISESVNGAHTVTLASVNGESFTITANTVVKWKYDPLVTYTKTCTVDMAVEYFAQTAPTIYKGNIQKFEKAYGICDDDITNYNFDLVPKTMQIWDPMTNGYINTWCLPEARANQIRNEVLFAEQYNLLWGNYDMVTDEGVDGWFATAQKKGQFNMNINMKDEKSFLASMKIIAKEYTRAGIKSAMVFGDQDFCANFSDLMSKTVGFNNFNLPVFKGMAFGGGDLTWYNFAGIKDMFGWGFDLQVVPLTGWEQMGYSDLRSNFGAIMPVSRFKTSSGVSVPAIEMSKLDYCDGTAFGAQNGKGNALWYDDARERLGRQLRIAVNDSYGFDFHGAQFFGILSGGTTCTF